MIATVASSAGIRINARDLVMFLLLMLTATDDGEPRLSKAFALLLPSLEVAYSSGPDEGRSRHTGRARCPGTPSDGRPRTP
jgi:hypothetical protein